MRDFTTFEIKDKVVKVVDQGDVRRLYMKIVRGKKPALITHEQFNKISHSNYFRNMKITYDPSGKQVVGNIDGHEVIIV